MFKAFQRLHFAGTKVTPDLMRLEMVSRGDMTEEVAASVVDSIVMLPPPENLPYLVQGLGRIQAQNMLSELVDFLQTPEAIKNGMAGAVARINDFVVNNHQVSAKKPESLREAMARSLGRTEPAKVWTPGLGKLDDYWKIR